MRTISVLVIGLLLGTVLGWLAHSKMPLPDGLAGPGPESAADLPLTPPADDVLAQQHQFDRLARRAGGDLARFVDAISNLRPEDRMIAIDRYRGTRGESFAAGLYKAGLFGAMGHPVQQVDELLATALMVRTNNEQQRLEVALSSATDAAARQLLAAHRYEALDGVYERVTLALPELPAYYLKLGQFRIQVGNFDAALAPLSQIENNRDIGARARALIAQAERSEAMYAPTATQILPLQDHGSQYVVAGVLDDGRKITLLIDTGAAMTVIDRSLLQSMGYALDDQQAYFVTAGGVVSAPVVTVTRLALGDAAIDSLAVGALELRLPGNIQGLLGMNFLRHFDFRIDQVKKQLHLDQRQ